MKNESTKTEWIYLVAKKLNIENLVSDSINKIMEEIKKKNITIYNYLDNCFKDYDNLHNFNAKNQQGNLDPRKQMIYNELSENLKISKEILIREVNNYMRKIEFIFA